jgi:hypothetical protein
MPLRVGDKRPVANYRGDRVIDRIYRGDVLLWQMMSGGSYGILENVRLTPTSNWTRMPLQLKPGSDGTNPVDGVLTLPKGYWRERWTMAAPGHYRSDIRQRIALPSGLYTPEQPGGPNSNGPIDVTQDFTTARGGQMSVEMAYTSAFGNTILASNYNVDIQLLSMTHFPSNMEKSGTFLIPAVANAFHKVEGFVPVNEFFGTTDLTNSEMLVEGGGDYEVTTRASWTTNVSTNQVRVVDQNGNVLLSRGNSNVESTSVVYIPPNSRIRMEVSTASVSTSGRRTITTATYLRVKPVI